MRRADYGYQGQAVLTVRVSPRACSNTSMAHASHVECLPAYALELNVVEQCLGAHHVW
jgi:hypothetical protein